MNEVLQVRGLKKDYGDFLLDEISFSVPEGCIAGFVGANGAGKTTTIRAILNLIHRDAGQIEIMGMDIEKQETEVKQRIGIVSDNGNYYGTFTLNEMKSVLAKAYRNWDEEVYRRLLQKFSLNGKQKLETLSRGMKVKFGLVLAMSHHAELLIMDEPSSGLDMVTRAQVMDSLKEYMEREGKGVLFSTHIASDIERAADMVILINHGKLIFREDKDSLRESCRLVKGGTEMLDGETESMLLGLEKNRYGFSAITDRVDEIRKRLPDAVFERTNLEEILMAYMGKGENGYDSRSA